MMEQSNSFRDCEHELQIANISWLSGNCAEVTLVCKKENCKAKFKGIIFQK